MISEAIEQIQKMSMAAMNGVVVNHAGLAPDTRLRVMPGQVPEVMVLPPLPRRHTATSMVGFSEQVVSMTKGVASAIYVGTERVVCIVGTDTRRESIELPLRRSLHSMTLESGMVALSQRDIVNILRSTFAGMIAPESFLPTLRQLKFSANSSTEGTVQTGRESLGNSVLAEVSGAEGPIPVSIKMTIPMYVGFPKEEAQIISEELDADVFIDMAKASFAIRPRAGAIDVAHRNCEAAIAEYLHMQLKVTAPEVVIHINSTPSMAY